MNLKFKAVYNFWHYLRGLKFRQSIGFVWHLCAGQSAPVEDCALANYLV
jgi:hypothetical protein